jgi:hypothetical protein
MAALAALSLALPALAQEPPRPLILGGTQLFMIRTGDTLNGREWSIGDRIGHVQDVYAKNLGGQYAKFTWKKWGDRVHLYLNDEFTLAVTPADAKATGYKTAEKLAPIWLNGLKKGFSETHVRVASPVRRN